MAVEPEDPAEPEALMRLMERTPESRAAYFEEQRAGLRENGLDTAIVDAAEQLAEECTAQAGMLATVAEEQATGAPQLPISVKCETQANGNLLLQVEVGPSIHALVLPPQTMGQVLTECVRAVEGPIREATQAASVRSSGLVIASDPRAAAAAADQLRRVNTYPRNGRRG